MIKNCIFDVGNVLVDFRPEEVMSSLGITGNRLETAADATFRNQLWSELDRGVLPEKDVIDMMCRSAPASAEKDIRLFFSEGGQELVTPFAYAAQWLRNLHERGFRVYLLSNYPSRLFEMHSRKFPFMPYVDGKIVSGYVKMIKPDPAIYRLLLDTFSLKADECTFVDDMEANVSAASKLGIHAIQFVSFESASSQLDALAGMRPTL